MKKIKVGIIGVSGYTGLALTQILLNHPTIEIVALCSGQQKGKKLFEIQPCFLGNSHEESLPLIISPEEIQWKNLDCVFTAAPNGVASGLVQKALEYDVKLIDLAADFRLKSIATFEEWYAPLKAPEEKYLSEAVYGLVEFNREAIKKAKILANPGCYPTASALGIIPLLKAGLAGNSLCIIDAKSGATGAGKKPEEGILFSEISESFSAYKVNKHRHTPEIEQSLEIFGQEKMHIRFTPHLLPIKRGILTTIYLKAKKASSQAEIQRCFQEIYQNETFIKVVSEPPRTKDVYGSNRCHIYGTYDERTGLIEVISVIDNLMKGASGQAVQNFNLMFGLNETEGLMSLGIMP